MKKLLFSKSLIIALSIIMITETGLFGMGRTHQWLKNCSINQFFETRPTVKRVTIGASILVPMLAVPAWMSSLLVWDKRPRIICKRQKFNQQESILGGLSAGTIFGLFACVYPGFAAVTGSGLLLGTLGSHIGTEIAKDNGGLF